MKLFLPYWVSKAFVDKKLILFNWRSNNSVKIYDTLHPAYSLCTQEYISYEKSIITHQEDIDWLIKSDFIITNSNNNIRISTPDRFNNDVLNLILLPAGEACNLDCVYCYEDHNDKQRMSKEHADTLIKMILNTNKKHIHIEYFGGEPMLNLNFISYLSAELTKLSISHSSSITTNGTLLNNNTLQVMYRSHIKSFQITLDGPENIHNQLRVSKSHKLNSFQRVIHALKTLVNSDFQDIKVILRLNINENSTKEENFNALTNIIEQTIPMGDKRFLILAKTISDYSSLNLKENIRAENNYCRSGNEVLNKFEEYFSKKYFSANSYLLTTKGGYTCYAGNTNSFVITPDFLIRKCTVALDDPINIVGSINSNSGQIELNENFELWIKDYSNNFCDGCFIQKSCQGNSCPLENIRNNKKCCPPVKQNINSLTDQVTKFHEKQIKCNIK